MLKGKVSSSHAVRWEEAGGDEEVVPDMGLGRADEESMQFPRSARSREFDLSRIRPRSRAGTWKVPGGNQRSLKLTSSRRSPLQIIAALQSWQRYRRANCVPMLRVFPTCLSPRASGLTLQNLQGIMVITS